MEKNNRKQEILFIKEKMFELCRNEYNKKNISGLYNSLFLIGKFLYTFNLEFSSTELEGYIDALSDWVIGEKDESNIQESVVFYDSLGKSQRGLAKIYIAALLKSKKHIKYITYKEHFDENAELRSFIENSGCGEVFYIERKLESINVAFELMRSSKHIFLYLYPEDVIALCAANKVSGKKYFIDFTDHAFWYGANVGDIFIEFRDYGANVCNKERNVKAEKIIKIPYYPNIEKGESFGGYPCHEMSARNTIFSGGSIYKTLDESNIYYDLVEWMMNNWNVFFWYAGFGNMVKLDELSKKFPGRVYITGERKDLYDIMNNVRFFLNTYPMIGGLMSQFAVIAKTPLVSLISDNSETGVLMRSGVDAFEFFSVEDAKEQIKLLFNDECYKEIKSNINPDELIIKKEKFDDSILKLINDEIIFEKYEEMDINPDYLRETYIERLDELMICKAVCKKNFYGFRTFKKYYFRYLTICIGKKCKNLFHIKD